MDLLLTFEHNNPDEFGYKSDEYLFRSVIVNMLESNEGDLHISDVIDNYGDLVNYIHMISLYIMNEFYSKAVLKIDRSIILYVKDQETCLELKMRL